MIYKVLGFLLPSLLCVASMDYHVHFIGINDSEALKTIKKSSSLITLKEKKPVSVNALRYRAESDIPDILKVLHIYGYYDATASIEVVKESEEADVFVMIHPGPVYTIQAFEITSSLDEPKDAPLLLQTRYLKQFLNAPANTFQIIEAEQKFLTHLSQHGYPLASLIERKVTADYLLKTVSIHLSVDPGYACYFGPVKITGAYGVKKRLFENKIAWDRGEIYDTRLVEETQKNLLDTGLFSSVIITHEPIVSEKGELPLRIEAIETKHKSINVGVSYQTFFGPGLTFGWENRNIGDLGRTLSLKGDVTSRTHTGTATFFIPDFWKVDQDCVIEAQAQQESIIAYHQHSYHLTERVERRIGTSYQVSAGLKLERLLVSNSVANGTFTLAEAPLYFRKSSANHLLDPTQGHTLELKVIPSANFSSLSRYYLYNSLTYASYTPLTQNNSVVLAQQLMCMTILSPNLSSVPVPKRVFGGSDDDLRGYRFKTVSPLQGLQPIGGRFGLFYTFESRFRLTSSIGLVPFFDIGTVELSSIPKWNQKWYQSAGIGIRYFTFLGPIRCDMAFPLNPRPEIDAKYRLLVSIGQTF
ncbi:autotransporter assembly complex family protein [Rhabdochlamydiaceae symbiont of Dictyostelium giganteum]|uniref:autotransporter assembly complex protein TamA n=1 Tax=Rhabdochlamydiaceae symbiont of Dictyostelium giganteum TaxID=3342349 RepID=UPI00384EFD97